MKKLKRKKLKVTQRKSKEQKKNLQLKKFVHCIYMLLPFKIQYKQQLKKNTIHAQLLVGIKGVSF